MPPTRSRPSWRRGCSRPVQAVIFAAFFNFAAYFLTIAFPELHKVAETIGKGLIDKDLVTPARRVRRAGRARCSGTSSPGSRASPRRRATRWSAGIVGAGVAHAGFDGHPVDRAQQDADRDRAVADARHDAGDADHAGHQLGAPPRDRAARREHASASSTCSRRPPIRSATASTMRRRRWGSSPCCSIRPAICSGEFHVPHWVAISCYIAIALGTLSGGWKIIETMGSAHHQAVAAPGLQRLDRRVDHGVHRLAARHSGVDHAHDYRLRSSAPAPRAAPRRCAGASRSNVVAAWVITIPASRERSRRRCSIGSRGCSDQAAEPEAG